MHRLLGQSIDLGLIYVEGPVVRVTPTLLIVDDPTKLPEIYHRQANKSKYYITGSFGKVESVFNMQDWRQHAHFRKFIAGPVSTTRPKGLLSAVLGARLFSVESRVEGNLKGQKAFEWLSDHDLGANICSDSIALRISRGWSR